MISVAHIITALGSGGAERVLFLVATQDSRASGARHVVYSLADEGMYGPQLRLAGVEVHCLGMRSGQASLFAFIRLVKLLRRQKPDIVMTWLYHADLLGTFAAGLAGVRRIIWNLRCSEFTFSDHPATTGHIVALLARLSRLPSAVAANSISGRRAHEALGYRPRRWIYLPNGFNTEEWRPDAAERARTRADLGLSDHHFVIGRIGRADPQKDFATFLEACRMLVEPLPSVQIMLIGQGTQELAIPSELRPRTLVLGERRDVPRLMRALDLLVSSSAYGEGLPNIVGEAMASGVPCVATDVGDSRALLDDAGLVVPPRDPRALARAMERVMQTSAPELAATIERARARVASEYSLERCLRRYAEVLQDAVTRSG
jgi:glycosyltransferase involved in cell wall biosynthesis